MKTLENQRERRYNRGNYPSGICMIIHKPKKLDYRIKKKFAIFPHTIDDRKDVWLQFYFRVERFETYWHDKGNFLTKEDADKFIKHEKERNLPKEKW